MFSKFLLPSNLNPSIFEVCFVLRSFLAMPSAIFSVATSVELRQVMCDYDLYPFYCPIIADKIYLH